jgi:hypothetical protein
LIENSILLRDERERLIHVHSPETALTVGDSAVEAEPLALRGST